VKCVSHLRSAVVYFRFSSESRGWNRGGCPSRRDLRTEMSAFDEKVVEEEPVSSVEDCA